MESQEFLVLKGLILDLKETIEVLLPEEVPLSFLVNRTGKSRQTLTAHLQSHYEQDVDWYKKNGKLMINQNATVKILRNYNEK